MQQDVVEQIKERLTIIDVVSPYVKLTKAGRNLRGLSPFNKEKTPSFYVNPERGTYFCFSSGQGGDHFNFIQKMEGVDFKGALKILAEKAGVQLVPLTAQSKQARDARDRLFEVMARAEALFTEWLLPGKGVAGSAYEYARSRGLSEESIAAWNVGYAPDGWRTLLEALLAEGYTQAELVAAGLVKEAEERKGTVYDRFRNRLMFPIKDSAGRTVAFTGRALTADDQAKYLNSPETALFKKSDILFGMHRAKDAIRQRGFVLLAEGQLDVLMLHQIGFTNTVALSGTAFTPHHLTLIKRYADNLMLALDADRAGIAASMKNAIAALQAGMRVKAVRLPQGKDPADLAIDDPKGLTKRIADSEPVVEFFLSVLAENETDTHRLVLAAEKTVLPLIQAMQSPMEQEHFVGVVARALGSTPDAVRAGLARLPRGGETTTAATDTRPEAPLPSSVAPSASVRAGERLCAVVHAYPETAIANHIKSEYSRIIGVPFPDEPPPEQLVFEVGIAYGEAPGEADADDLIRAFEKAYLTEQLAAATARLRIAEASRHEPDIITAGKECAAITRRLSAFL